MPGYLIQYDEHPNLKILKNQILSSCGHFVEHWQKKIKSNQVSLCCTVLARSTPVAMPWEDVWSMPAPSAPTQALEEGGEEKPAPPDPPLFFPAACTSTTTLPSPVPTHSTPRPRPKPSSTPPWPPCPWSLDAHARTPATASFWPRLPSTLRPIKGPADQTKQCTSFPSPSQTSPLSLACPSSPLPASPEQHWTSGAPPRPTTWRPAAAGNRRRRRTAADPARRQRVLLPLRLAIAVEQSSLLAGELPPC
jgi:hypothetical protein